MQITIEVEAPEGYELTGEYRTPRADETFLNAEGAVATAHHTFSRSRYLILRPKWKPHPKMPEGAWLYRCCGVWFFTDKQPERRGKDYESVTSGQCVNATELAPICGFNFTPPPVDCIQIKHE